MGDRFTSLSGIYVRYSKDRYTIKYVSILPQIKTNFFFRNCKEREVFSLEIGK